MNSPSNWAIEKSIPSDLDVAHELIEQTVLAMTNLDWPGGDVFHVQMAMEEALVNAIEHGNKRCESKQVFVAISVATNEISVQIKDQGDGFDHRNVADPTEEERLDQPRGRGVLLIRELMSDSRYNDIGNELVMIKKRSVAE
ncbi:MAG: ATP-binding protein [Pirellula sp.]|jgi:serine/threonine-protein kinase RsbW|nr:ATP-binding protein [Pirellula sp.]